MFAPKIERMDTASVNKRLSQRLSLAATGGSGDGDGKGDEPGAKRGKRGRKVKRGAGEGEAEEEEGLLKADIYTVADFCYMAQMGYERAFMYFWKLAVRAKAEEIAVREGIIERKNSMLERQGSVAEVVADDEDGDSEDDEEESTGVFAHGVVARPEELVLDPSNPHHVRDLSLFCPRKRVCLTVCCCLGLGGGEDRLRLWSGQGGRNRGLPSLAHTGHSV